MASLVAMAVPIEDRAVASTQSTFSCPSGVDALCRSSNAGSYCTMNGQFVSNFGASCASCECIGAGSGCARCADVSTDS